LPVCNPSWQNATTTDGFEAKIEIAQDDCTVILIKHDEEKSRKIFNKVNRYAKKTTKAEDLITADDDVIAVVVREEIAEKVIPARLINYKSNTLSKLSYEFTTLSTIYEGTKYVLEDLENKKINTQRLPSPADIEVYRDEAKSFWETIIEEIDLFDKSLHNPGKIDDEKLREIRRDYVLGKPAAQLAVIQAIVRLRSEDDDTGERIGLTEACQRINRLNWSVNNSDLQDVLLTGERIVFGKTAVSFAARIISFWIGKKLSIEEEKDLKHKYKENSGRELMIRNNYE